MPTQPPPPPPGFAVPPSLGAGEEGDETKIRASKSLLDDLRAIAALEGRSLNLLITWYLLSCRDAYKVAKGIADLQGAAAKLPAFAAARRPKRPRAKK